MDVELSPKALEQYRSLPGVIQKRVQKVLARLESWPAVSGVKVLSASLAGWYRIRTGDYRVRFRVLRDHICVDKIGHRKDVYED